MLTGILRHNEQTRTRPDSRREQVGPLAMLTSAQVDRPVVNYAWPHVERDHGEALHIHADHILEVVNRFHAAARQARFEFPAEIAPSLGLLLDEHGFVETRRMPLMAWRWPSQVDLPGDLELRIAQSEHDMRAHLEIYHHGFELPLPEELDRLIAYRLQEVKEGRRLFLTAEWHGTPVATAQLILGPGSAEIVGLTTLHRYRGKGIGGAITHLTTQLARERGADLIFLASASDEATRLYQRMGYQKVGTTVTWIEQPA